MSIIILAYLVVAALWGIVMFAAIMKTVIDTDDAIMAIIISPLMAMVIPVVGFTWPITIPTAIAWKLRN